MTDAVISVHISFFPPTEFLQPSFPNSFPPIHGLSTSNRPPVSTSPNMPRVQNNSNLFIIRHWSRLLAPPPQRSNPATLLAKPTRSAKRLRAIPITNPAGTDTCAIDNKHLALPVPSRHARRHFAGPRRQPLLMRRRNGRKAGLRKHGRGVGGDDILLWGVLAKAAFVYG